MTDERGYLRINSTSRTTARVDSITLRPGDTGRLVFKPELVSNPSDPAASVKGDLFYEKKQVSGAWKPIEAVNLTTLRSDDGVRLRLDSAEVLALYRHLTALYAFVEQDGIPAGQRRVRLVDWAPEQEELDEETFSELTGFVREQGVDTLRGLLRSERGADAAASLSAKLSAARLINFLESADALIESDDEAAWQALLQRESWVISQVWAQPCIIIRGQAYLGGKEL